VTLYLLIAIGVLTVALGFTGKLLMNCWESKAEITGIHEAFVVTVEEKGKKAIEEKRQKEAANAQVLKDTIAPLQKDILKLRSDNSMLQRVLDHHVSAASSRVPEVPPVAPGTGSGEPVGVSVEEYRRLDAAARGLAADGAETARLFAACRDAWKSLSRN